MRGVHVKRLDRSVGIELEGFVSKRDKPVSLVERLRSPIKLPSGIGFAEVTKDAGLDQIELVTDPAWSTLDLFLQLRELENLAHRSLGFEDINIQYLPRRPSGIQSGGESWKAVPRLRAMVEALCRPEEGNGHGKEVYGIGDICAAHFHFGFTNVLSYEGVLACNLLNLLAPVATQYVHETYGIASTRRNLGWSNFARPERLPASRWFPDVSEFRAFFESIPRLIKPTDSGYEVDLVTRQRLNDPVSTGTTWWAARIRPEYNTVEFRPLPSLPIPVVVAVLPLIDAWLSQALERVGDLRFENTAAASSSGRIPLFEGRSLPSSDSDWLHTWLRY